MYRFVPVVVREMCWGRYAGPWLGCDAAVEGGGCEIVGQGIQKLRGFSTTVGEFYRAGWLLNHPSASLLLLRTALEKYRS